MAENNHNVSIEAGKVRAAYWKDIWRYRELFYFLAWRDVLVRYKQTVIGVLWSVLKPLLTMMVFVFVFGKIAKLPSDGIPYPILVLTGMLPWLFFAAAFSEAGNSLIGNANIISKVYFPRLIVPLSSIMVSFVDFLISALLLIGFMVFFKVIPNGNILFLPIFVLLLIAVAVGAGLWVAALNVKYRDFRYIVPVVTQLGFYASPVAFTSSLVPEKWRLLYALNPLVSIIDGFRWSITGVNASLYIEGIFVSIGVIVILFISGIYYFRKTERHFADVI